jgi:hypothetical protein
LRPGGEDIKAPFNCLWAFGGQRRIDGDKKLRGQQHPGQG